MNDPAQSNIANSKSQIANSQDDSSQQTSTAPPQPVVTPVGTPQKEQEGSAAPVSEFVKPSESEPELPPEVEKAGVEAVKTPAIDKEAQALGIKVMHEQTPVVTQPSGAVQLPMTQAQAQAALKKNKNVKNSLAWLATVILRQLKMRQTSDV